MFNFKHRKDEFFGMFDKAARNVHAAAEALLDLLEHYEDVPNKVKRIKNLEHAGDEYTHQMLDKLARMFITPLEWSSAPRVFTRQNGRCWARSDARVRDFGGAAEVSSSAAPVS